MTMRPRTGPGRRAALIAVSLGVIAAGALYVANERSETPAAPHPALAVGEFPEPGVIHVHGLGVDPGDGALYAATHSGLFRIQAQGRAERVANRYQDTMGFTVTGPRTFLGSGHPDLRENIPVRLGLIESTDAGQSWTALSLQGRADFHALQAVHGRVYGYDSTSETFMVSPDRRRWDARSKLVMRGFVVSPTEPDTILASTPRGVLRSTDGGRRWQPISGAPALAALAWPQTQSLYGVSADGTVQHSSDGGASWTVRGRVNGEPEALTVDVRDGAQTLYVAVAGRGILASTDGGRSFTTRYAE